jgi:predicted RNase H-like nuclease (RuvC/YqgF family)
MMQWERKKVEAEKAKLQEEIQSLKAKIEELRDKENSRCDGCGYYIYFQNAVPQLEKELAEAKNDRDQYKCRVDELQSVIKEKEHLLIQVEVRSQALMSAQTEIDFLKGIINNFISKKEG